MNKNKLLQTLPAFSQSSKNYQSFLATIEKAAHSFEQVCDTEVYLLHHNDTDGLSSGAILQQAFERAGLMVRRYCLEKPYPEALRSFFIERVSSGDVVVFTDFASGALPRISKHNQQQAEVFLLDHHTISPVRDSSIHLVNCIEHGINGSAECSASLICALFAMALQPDNIDLGPAGILGMVGDRYVNTHGEATGMGEVFAAELLGRGQLSWKGDDYFSDTIGLSFRHANKLLNSLGSFAYLEGGPDIGIKGLTEGFTRTYVDKAEEAERVFEGAYQTLGGAHCFHQSDHIQWFSLGDEFSGMGVKTVGLVCERLRDEGFVDTAKYIAGFQPVPKTIPGLCILEDDSVKISMRVTDEMHAGVISGKFPALTDFLPQATEKLGGFVDACHRHAAATTIPAGKEEELISEMNSILKGLL